MGDMVVEGNLGFIQYSGMCVGVYSSFDKILGADSAWLLICMTAHPTWGSPDKLQKETANNG